MAMFHSCYARLHNPNNPKAYKALCKLWTDNAVSPEQARMLQVDIPQLPVWRRSCQFEAGMFSVSVSGLTVGVVWVETK